MKNFNQKFAMVSTLLSNNLLWLKNLQSKIFFQIKIWNVSLFKTILMVKLYNVLKRYLKTTPSRLNNELLPQQSHMSNKTLISKIKSPVQWILGLFFFFIVFWYKLVSKFLTYRLGEVIEKLSSPKSVYLFKRKIIGGWCEG